MSKQKLSVLVLLGISALITVGSAAILYFLAAQEDQRGIAAGVLTEVGSTSQYFFLSYATWALLILPPLVSILSRLFFYVSRKLLPEVVIKVRNIVHLLTILILPATLLFIFIAVDTAGRIATGQMTNDLGHFATIPLVTIPVSLVFGFWGGITTTVIVLVSRFKRGTTQNNNDLRTSTN